MPAAEPYPGNRLRLQTSIRLRWFAVAGQLAAVCVVHYVFRFPLPIGACMVLIAASAWLNVYLRARYSPNHRLDARFGSALLSYDLLQLAALLYLTGGIDNPFVFLLVVPVTVSAATFPTRHTIVLGAVAVLVAALLVEFHLALPWYEQAPIGFERVYQLGMLASVCSSMVFLAMYAWRLANEARQMSEALAATEMVLAREQRMQALDGLAAAAAHELGTPLSTIAVVSREIERTIEAGKLPDASVVEDLRLLRSQALRCRDILQTLTRQPAAPDPLHARVSLTQLIEEAARPYAAVGEPLAIDIAPDPTVTPPTSEPVGERRAGAIHALANIVENACDFARSKVEIQARWTGGTVVITVSDDGPGFDPDIADVLGEPYVTTRRPSPSSRTDGNRALPDGGERGEDRSGLGLGLFIAKTLLERTGADVTFANRANRQGAVVRMSWARGDFEAGAATGSGWLAPPPA